jgi:hypothetical protein
MTGQGGGQCADVPALDEESREGLVALRLLERHGSSAETLAEPAPTTCPQGIAAVQLPPDPGAWAGACGSRQTV